VTRGRLAQTKESPSLNGGGAAAAVPPVVVVCYNLYCVGGDVKHCSIQSNVVVCSIQNVSDLYGYRDLAVQDDIKTDETISYSNSSAGNSNHTSL